MADYDIFELGDLVLQSGATLRGAKLAFKTHGALNASKDNVVVFPTSYGSPHTVNHPLIGENMALDPRKYFIVLPNMFGNGCPPRQATPLRLTPGPGSPTSPCTTT